MPAEPPGATVQPSFPADEKGSRWPIRLVSAVIVFLILAQFIAVALPIRRAAWPFTDYPMYYTPHYEGDVLQVTIPIFAELDDGSIVEITQRDVDLNFFRFFYHARCVAGRDNCPEPDEFIDNLVTRYQDATGNVVRRLEARTYPMKITREGPVPAPSEVLGEVTIADRKSVPQ